MNIQELLNKGFSAKSSKNIDMLDRATPKGATKKEQTKGSNQRIQPSKEQPKVPTFTESEVKEIIKKYASMENKRLKR